MAITKADFNKIWGVSSSVPEYTFSDQDYADGWEFVGNLPPTRAMWDKLQKRNDEKMQYLMENGTNWVDDVASLRATDANVGEVYCTKGYYSVNDGGGATYTIRAKVVGDEDDGGNTIILNNDTVAEMIVNDNYDRSVLNFEYMRNEGFKHYYLYDTCLWLLYGVYGNTI